MIGNKAVPQDAQALLQENLRLKRALEELSFLNDLARSIGASHDSEEVMQTIIRRSLRSVNAEQGDITLVDKESKHTMKTLVRTMVSSTERQPLHLNENLLGWMHINKKPLSIDDPAGDPRFRGVKWDESIHSLVCVPLMAKSELIGILTLYNKKGSGGFTENDQRLLAITAAQSAQVVENARLYEKEKALLQINEQVRLASDIQGNLLPDAAPVIPGYDIVGKSIPAQNVGGDYFDFIKIDARRLVVCLGDISGKGLPAALLMANLQATIRGQALFSESVCQCVERANRLLFRSTDDHKFATLFYSVLNHESHKFSYCNAGHNPPLHFSSGAEPVELSTGGIMVGVIEDAPFAKDKVWLQPGDLVLIYSDGVTEALDADDEEFGELRLKHLVSAHRRAPAAQIVDQIITAVQEFAGDTPQSDDITIVAIKRDTQ